MLKGALNIDNRVYGGVQCNILATKKLILQQKTNKVCKPKKKKKIVMWPMMWLNKSVATIITILQLLDIYR